LKNDLPKASPPQGLSFLQGMLLAWTGLLALNLALFPPYPGAWLYVIAALGEILLAWGLLRRNRQPRSRWGIGCGLLILTSLVMGGTAFFVEGWPEGKLPFLTGLTGLVARLTATVPVPQGWRLFHPNTLALMAVPVVPLQIALSMESLVAGMGRGRRRSRVYFSLILLALFTLPVTLGLLLASQSRAGLVALAVGLGFMVISLLPGWIRGLVLVGLAVLMGWAWPGLAAWWQASEGRLSTLTVSRFTLWRLGLFITWGFPLTGIGFHSLRFWYPRLFPPDLYPEVTVRTNAHNAYMQMAADMGLPGLIWYLALTFGVLFLWFRLWSRRKRAIDAPGAPPGFLLGLGGSWAALMVFGLGESNGPGFFSKGGPWRPLSRDCIQHGNRHPLPEDEDVGRGPSRAAVCWPSSSLGRARGTPGRYAIGRPACRVGSHRGRRRRISPVGYGFSTST